MRINPVAPNLLYKSYNNKQPAANTAVSLSTPPQITQLSVMPRYFISFKGYTEDKNFLENSSKILQNAMNRTAENYACGNLAFEQALEVLQDQSPEMYKQFLGRKELLKNYEQDFNVFNDTVLASLNQVRHEGKYYTEFWEQNSTTGNKKTADIIKQAANSPDTDINETIKNASRQEYQKIKDALVLGWFENVLNQKKRECLRRNPCRQPKKLQRA